MSDDLQNQYGGFPPQQQYGAPAQQGWGGAPPQQGCGLNPPQSYGGPPSPQPYGGNNYGAPPPQSPYGQAQQPYGAPPQQALDNRSSQPYGAPPGPPYGAPPTPQQSRPSPGYDANIVANVDTTRDAKTLRDAMKGFGTNETQLIQVLTRIPDPYIMANLRKTYQQQFRRDLIKDLDDETSGYFQETLQALARGPLAQDVHNLHDAIEGVGTKESVLNDVLLGRSNGDIQAIKHEYHRVHHRTLESDVKGDLSFKTERLFTMVLSAQRADESAPVIPQKLEADVLELHRATEGRVGTDQVSVCHILSSNSNGQIRAISQEFQRRYAVPLSKVIEREFSGHMEVALLRMLHLAEDRAMVDAVGLEDTMKGPGTKDRLLLNRLVRIHWNRDHMGQVKGAYQHRFKKDLGGRVHGETSGDYRKILMAVVTL